MSIYVKGCASVQSASDQYPSLAEHKLVAATSNASAITGLLSIAIPSELDEGIDFLNIEEKCVLGRLIWR
jgi:hypothetical protein